MDEDLYSIYKITNIVNGKIYVGTTNCIQYRWYAHRSNARRGKKPLYQDMRVYGLDKFTIEAIEEDISSGIAYDREAYWIDRLGSVIPHGYNMDHGSMKRAKAAATAGKH
jgi:group I intron endonuclease